MRIRWRGLELPTSVQRDEAAGTSTYGRFLVEPFERGFGTTVGNSLRRILLSSLEGAAVTHVKIQGAEHEFCTLRGVMEDVTVIILNIKSLVIRSESDEPKSMRLSARGKAGETTAITASQIEADPALEIVNTGQVIATLTDAVDLNIEMTVGKGRGYWTADDNKPEDQDQVIGVIPVDSVFSPVTRVRYRVEDTRVGQRTNYDRLVLEIWTNGTVTPEMALVEAAKILRKHLNPFVQYFDLGSGLAVEGELNGSGAGRGGNQEKLSKPISELELSVRANNCLTSARIGTVGELVAMSQDELLRLRSFGKTSLREVKRKLADMGLTLKGDMGAASDVDGDDDEDLDEVMHEDSVSSEPQVDSTVGRLPTGPFVQPSSVVKADSPVNEQV